MFPTAPSDARWGRAGSQSPCFQRRRHETNTIYLIVAILGREIKQGGERGVILDNTVPGPLFVGVTGAET